MKKLFFLLFFFPGLARAQTLVTATVVDPNGNPYANGTASAFTVAATGQPFTTTSPVPTSATGAFTLSLAPNTWIFTVCAPPVLEGQQSPAPPPTQANGIPSTNPAPKQICFSSGPLTIGGPTQDVSVQLNAVAALLGPRLGGNAGNTNQPFLIRTNSPNCTTQGQLVIDDKAHLDSTATATVQNAPAGSTTNVLGVVIQGAGCSGLATIATYLSAFCVMDGTAVVGDTVSPSGSVAGFCSDEGSSQPNGAVNTIGTVARANTGGAGTLALVDFFIGTTGPGQQGSGTISPCIAANCDTYYPAANIANVAGDQFATDDGAGHKTARSLQLTDANHAGNLFQTQGPQPAATPLNSIAEYAPTSVPTPYAEVRPGASGSVGQTRVIQSTGTDSNGNPILIEGWGTAGGSTVPLTFSTVPQPSAPTCTVNGTPGSTTITYAVVALQDIPGTQHTQASPVCTVSTANGTLSSSNSVTLSGYQLGSNGTSVKCWKIYRVSTNGTSPTTTGLIASCVNTNFTDTGLAGDSSTAPNTNTTVLIANPQLLPGCPIAFGGVAGTVDAPNCITNALDDDFNWVPSVGNIADVNNTQWTLVPAANGVTLTLSGGMLQMQDGSHGGSDSMKCIMQPVPAAPYAYAAWMDANAQQPNTEIAFGGIGWTDGTKFAAMQGELDANNTTNTQRLVLSHYTSNTAETGVNTTSLASFPNNGYYFALKNDGANLKYYTSPDGVFYVLQGTEAIGAFITPTKIGVCIDSLTGTNQFGFDYFHSIPTSRLP